MPATSLHYIADELEPEAWDWDAFAHWLAVWPVEARVLSNPAMTGLAVIDPGRPRRDA